MNTTPSPLETRLRQAPVPLPPDDLLADLERQVCLPPPKTADVSPPWWRRFWIPATGFGGAALLIALGFVFSDVATPRALAASIEALRRVKTVHIIERYRDGKSYPRIRDPKKGPYEWPNYGTSDHPSNQLATAEHWIQAATKIAPRRSRTISPDREVWRDGNKTLEIDRTSGHRTLRLAPDGLSVADAIPGFAVLSGTRFQETDLTTESITPDGRIWSGESRHYIGGVDETLIVRVWIDRETQLPIRMQQLTTAFSEIQPETLVRDWEFTDYDKPLAPELLAWEVMESDLQPLGISRSEFDQLDERALSFEFTGEPGLAVTCELTDGAGSRIVKGVLPLTFVQTRSGDLEFVLRPDDGALHTIRVRFNGSDMACGGLGMKGFVRDALGETGINSL